MPRGRLCRDGADQGVGDRGLPDSRDTLEQKKRHRDIVAREAPATDGSLGDSRDNGPMQGVGVAPQRDRDAANRRRLTVGLLLIELIYGAQQLMVLTAMPRIADDLGGTLLYGWVFAAFALGGMAALPRTSLESERRGVGATFLAAATIFAAGTVAAALSPTMSLLVVARAVQGYGGSALYATIDGVLAQAYSEPQRGVIVGLRRSAWLVAALLGPALGALVAISVGWRGVFIAAIPVVGAVVVLVRPMLQSLPPPYRRMVTWRDRQQVRWPLQLAVGLSVGLSGLAHLGWIAFPLMTIGAVVARPAQRRLLPMTRAADPSSGSARLAVILLASAAFFSVDIVIPPMITFFWPGGLMAGALAVALATLGWAAGSWWRRTSSPSPSTSSRIRGGAIMLCVTILATGSAFIVSLDSAMLVAWTLAGASMGVLSSAAFVPWDRGGETATRTGIAVGAAVATAILQIGHDANTVTAGFAAVIVTAAVCAGLAALAAPRRDQRPLR